MHIHNADIASVFSEIADLLELEEGNPFRIRAYRNAARTVETLAPSVEDLLQEGRDLSELPGIGADLAGKIAEIVHGGGTCALREQLRHELPEGIGTLLRIPGLGPKRVKLLYQERGIHTPEQLLRACEDGQLRTIHGLGEKAEQRILEAVQSRMSKTTRYSIALAVQLIEPLVRYLKQHPAVVRVEAAGSLRRMKETVGDVDIVVASRRMEEVTAHFVRYEGVGRVISHGPTRASIELAQGMQVDLRAVEPESFGAALHYFTGSKAHNIEIRTLALKRDLKINEYGVFAGEARIAGDTEESVFASVGLPFIAPELRENRGEIEAARDGKLPHLVQLSDLKGDLHSHTRASDGRNSLREMALEAQRRGMAYLGITDHARHGGWSVDADALARQADEIDRLNEELEGITLLKGVEVDILEDGALDLPDAALARLDYAIASLHTAFELSREKQTARVLRAMDHSSVCVLGHPTARLLTGRAAVELDVERVIRHARECGCALELDSQPERLDLNDSYCMMARDQGVLVAIDSDAHSVLDFDNLRYGIGQGRRGWLEKRNVLNTRTLGQLREVFDKHRTAVH
ncbi:DNA polymerase/3'-5' exonuclease PolX [Massilia agilis]|uniref:DNA polymerase beta n=1 Tax=Massilia agilis TaxID=1811226 RepID=A0ABT2D788_9BURK|nr:DNA polymerase/3'-5' exonuclease PolX [Massilia agilis]MCS0807187.1 DNA polymerase/3'-5' exonuclease PolX [Massilia agilis]